MRIMSKTGRNVSKWLAKQNIPWSFIELGRIFSFNVETEERSKVLSRNARRREKCFV
jgi:hypothetical protein